MKYLPAIAEILLSFFGITLLFSILNDSAVFPYAVMEKIWLGYLPLLSFFYAYFYGRHYTFRGGGIFLAFCLIGPAVIFSYYAELPWGYFFFAPLPLTLAGVASILGEAIGNVQKKTLQKNNKKSESSLSPLYHGTADSTEKSRPH